MSIYNIQEHLHRYAIWAAGRAIHRGLKNFQVEILKEILNNIEVRQAIDEFLKNEVNNDSFENFHRNFANCIITKFNNKKITITYGRAAKIIAIYFKTTIIITEKGEGKFSNYIHPPIDKYLLRNLSKHFNMPRWKYLKWTKLNEQEYWQLIREIKQMDLQVNWKLEEFWNITSGYNKA